MGWASGSDIMESVICAVAAEVKDFDAKYRIYKEVYADMRNADWDTVDECLGIDPAFDQVAAEDGWGNDWEEDNE
jgi:hypothetical protein